jgi:hypothetical protein
MRKQGGKVGLIWESSYWKQELLHIAERMRKRAGQRRWTDRSFFLLEKDVLSAFFGVRKLIEAKTKLPDAVAESRVGVLRFPSLEKNTTLRNRHRVNELFNFDRGTEESMALEKLCNQFIHSYVLEFSFDEDKNFEGILACSDRKRNRELYLLHVEELIRILEDVGTSDVTFQASCFDPETRDYYVRSFDNSGKNSGDNIPDW